jgi:hypothetical protein
MKTNANSTTTALETTDKDLFSRNRNYRSVDGPSAEAEVRRKYGFGRILVRPIIESAPNVNLP